MDQVYLTILIPEDDLAKVNRPELEIHRHIYRAFEMAHIASGVILCKKDRGRCLMLRDRKDPSKGSRMYVWIAFVLFDQDEAKNYHYLGGWPPPSPAGFLESFYGGEALWACNGNDDKDLWYAEHPLDACQVLVIGHDIEIPQEEPPSPNRKSQIGDRK